MKKHEKMKKWTKMKKWKTCKNEKMKKLPDLRKTKRKHQKWRIISKKRRICKINEKIGERSKKTQIIYKKYKKLDKKHQKQIKWKLKNQK